MKHSIMTMAAIVGMAALFNGSDAEAAPTRIYIPGGVIGGPAIPAGEQFGTYFSNSKTVSSKETVINGDVHLTKEISGVGEVEYVLEQLVYFKDGDLTIDPGVVIRGVDDSYDGDTGDDDPGTLIIPRDSKIFANGNKNNPIIFTNLDDDAIGGVGTGAYAAPNNIVSTCGGVIVLGKAQTSVNACDSLTDGGQIEGLTLASLGRFGGNPVNQPTAGDPETLADDDDSSGSISYMSIRYGGEIIGQNNEINGLSMGAVGRGTKIDHVEVVNNQDDGLEFFGCTVDTRHILVWKSGDDSFDTDHGYRGKGQFWCAITGDMTSVSGSGSSDNTFEMDGPQFAKAETGCDPLSVPTIHNFTLVGSKNVGENTMNLTEQTSGRFINGIITNYAAGPKGEPYGGGSAYPPSSSITGIGPASLYTHDPEGLDTYEMTQINFYDAPVGIASGTDVGLSSSPLITSITTHANGTATAEVTKIDPRPVGDALSTNHTAPSDGFFVPTTYKGAFAPNEPVWVEGWTLAWTYGVIVSDASAEIGFVPSITFPTGNGVSYDILASDDLVTFTDIGDVTGTGSVVEFVDPRPGLTSRQFYKVVLK